MEIAAPENTHAHFNQRIAAKNCMRMAWPGNVWAESLPVRQQTE
jgi:hypothetical protein